MTARSTLELPKLVKQGGHDVSFHHRLPIGRIAYVNLLRPANMLLIPCADVAGSFMNTVILTSVLSAGNHALFAGTRVLYGLATTTPRQAPAIFSTTTASGIPLFALLATSSISILCFGSSFIGSGELWGWLQNIVGVSNQASLLTYYEVAVTAADVPRSP